MSLQSSKVSVLLTSLIKKMIPHASDQAAIDGIHQYCMRILSSRITGGDTYTDEIAIVHRIQSSFSQTKLSNEFTGLFQRLSGKKTLRQLAPLLLLLFSLKNNPTIPSTMPSSDESLLSSLVHLPLQTSVAHDEQPQERPSLFSASRTNRNSTVMFNEVEFSSLVKSRATLGHAPLPKDEDLPEPYVIRDILYVFQGIDGEFIKYDLKADAYIIPRSGGVRVSPSVRDCVTRLAEVGWLFRKIKLFAEDIQNHYHAKGLIVQSFASALQKEVAEHYRLVSVLESQLSFHEKERLVSSSLSSPSPSISPHTAPRKLTLKRLLVWMEKPIKHMKALAMLVDAVGSKHGGALVSSLHAFVLYGAPELHDIIFRICQQATAPLLNMIWWWVFEGKLEDPKQEFFVALNPNIPLDVSWYRKYSLKTSMYPSFFTEETSKTILFIGKSINFLRECCDDQDWIFSTSDAAKKARSLSYGQSKELESVIKGVGDAVSHHLFEVMFVKYKLMEHLAALKRYLLLGQGDFVHYLMEIMEPELNPPSHTIFKHNLLSMLETAIRGSIAQFDEQDILNRLDIRLQKALPGKTGWDIFMLDYHVDAPINTVLTTDVMKIYYRIFDLMWNIKRVEFAINTTWQRHKTLHKTLDSFQELRGPFATFNLMRNEMFHFMYNLQYYIMFEALEVSWHVFQADIQQSKHLDNVITAHNKYLQQILEKLLLSKSSAQLLAVLNRLLSLILSFATLQDDLYQNISESVEKYKLYIGTAYEDDLIHQFINGDEKNTKKEKPSILDYLDPILPEATTKMEMMLTEYRQLMMTFTRALELRSTQGDETIVYLQSRLDFNEFYSNLEKKNIESALLTEDSFVIEEDIKDIQ